MANNEEIFSHFQVITGIEDAGKCLTILESFEWQLEKAIEYTLQEANLQNSSDVSTNNFPVEPIEAEQDSSSCNLNSAFLFTEPNESRFLNFDVEYRNTKKQHVCKDFQTVGELKESLSKSFNLPLQEVSLRGWPNKNDNFIQDSDTLKSLNLQQETRLFILTPNIPVVHSGLNVQINTAPIQNFTLTFKHTPSNKEITKQYPGSKVIQEIKKEIGIFFQVPSSQEVWIGWPEGDNFNDQMSLIEANLPPISFIELRSSSPQTNGNSFGSSVDAVKPSIEEGTESDGEDEVYDDAMDIDNTFPSSMPPLVSSTSEDPFEITESFSRQFALRYGEPHPVFYIGPLEEAIRDSILLKTKDRKMLAVYLHHDASIFSHVFCSQVLCTESCVSILTANFVCWGWDLTLPSNRDNLLNSCKHHFGTVASTSVEQRLVDLDRLPVLLIISRHRGCNEVVEIIEGNNSLMEVIPRLMHTVEITKCKLEVESADEMEREARAEVLAEQDAAYQESLNKDRAKAYYKKKEKEENDKKKEEEEKKKQEEINKKIEEENKQKAMRDSLADNLPDEPPANPLDPRNVVTFKIRCPENKVLSRKFYKTNTLSDLLNFVTTQGYPAQKYKFLTAFPRRDLKQENKVKSFESLKIANQEVITLEEV